MAIKEYMPFKPTKEELEILDRKFQKPVRDWDIKFLLGVPYGNIIDNAKSAIPMMCYYAKKGIPISTVGSQFTDVQRNEFGIFTLSENFDYLIMLDIDQENGENIIERFAYIAYLLPDAQVVAMNVPTQGKPHYPAWYYMSEEDSDYLEVPVEWEEDKGLIRAGMVGTGAIMIKKNVFQTLPFPWFQNDYSKAFQGEYIREDTYFCNLCRKHGVKMWVDPNVKVGHYLKNHKVTVDDYKENLERYGEKYLFDNR